MSTLKVVGLQNPASGTVNGTLNADGTTTFNGVVTFATGQTFPSSASTMPPATPSQGSTWYDTGVTPAQLKVWNGSAWVPVSNNQSGTAPTSPTTGQQWTDTSTVPPVLKIWNGSAWIPASVAISNGVAPTSPVTGQLWSDTSTTPATLKAYNGTTWVPVQAAGGGGAGTVTAVSGTAPIAVATGTTTPVVSITAGTARQLLQTNAGGTAAEFTSNVDIPGTLDVTGVATFDGIASHPLGTAAAPSVTFTGDLDTGIFSPGAGRVGVANNGVGTVEVTAAGSVLIGGTLPGTPNISLNANGSAALNGSSGSFVSFANAGAVVGYEGVASQLYTGGSSGDYGLSGGSLSNLVFATGDVERLRIVNTLGDVLVKGAGALPGTPAVSLSGAAPAASMVVDSSGRLLVGTSTARDNLYSNSSGVAPQFQIEGTSFVASSMLLVRNSNDGNNNAIVFGKTRGTSVGSNTVVQSGDPLGAISFQGADGSELAEGASIQARVDGTPGTNDMPGRLVFSTTPSGSATPVEAMRLENNGTMRVSGTIYRGGNCGLRFSNTDLIPQSGTAANADNAINLGNGTNRWAVVYAGTGTINTSDSNLKQDIQDLEQSELNVASAIKGLIKKFRFTDAVATKGNDARIHVGVIAQEVEQAFVAEGLDPRRYGMFCEDTLEDGSKRLGIRYDELLAFIIAAL
jgi:hypothetical protein